MDDMYRDYILDHYKNPRNQGELVGATNTYSDSNPLCGDELSMALRIDDDRVADVRFSGKGCAISQASASILTEEIKGKTLDEIKAIGREFHLSRKVVRKVIRSESTEFRYERGRQPLPRIDPWRDRLDGL